MATYDYTCSHCHEVFEIEKPIKDGDKEEKCLLCGNTLKKIFKPLPIRFEGTGWTKK